MTTKFLYIEDPRNPDRVVSFGYRSEGHKVHVSWAINKCGARRFFVRTDDSDFVGYVYDGEHDVFSKSEARILCDKRLDAESDSHRVTISYDPRTEYPIEAIYRSFALSEEAVWHKLPRVAEFALAFHFYHSDFLTWQWRHGKSSNNKTDALTYQVHDLKLMTTSLRMYSAIGWGIALFSTTGLVISLVSIFCQ